MTPVEVIYKAADYMEVHGKATGEYEDAKGRVCAVGAVRKVTSSLLLRQRVADMLGDQACREGWDGTLHLSDSTSDKRKVVRFMRRAARLYEKEHADG